MALALHLQKEMNDLLQKLKEPRGEFLLDRAFTLIIGAVALCIIISVVGVAFQSNKLTTIANDLTRFIEIRGEVDTASINSELSALTAVAGLENVTVDVDATYNAGGRRIQYGSSFTVTLHYTGEIGLGGFLSIPIPLHSSVMGRSEVYWK